MSILTYEKYAETPHPIPYKLVLKKNGTSLHYFGEKHTYEPKHPQWDVLKNFWSRFLEETAGRKRVVLIEGGIRPVAGDEEQAIIEYGGMGLLTYLANKEGIEVFSPEPDEKYERAQAEKHFPRDVIQYYYFARVVLQWNRKSEPKPDFVGYITRYLESDREESGWDDYDFSLDHMKSIQMELFYRQFDEHDEKFFYDASNPVIIQSDVNKVSALSSIIRDQYIVDQIQKYMQDGYSIFAEYGCSHVVMQEPALREMFNAVS